MKIELLVLCGRHGCPIEMTNPKVERNGVSGVYTLEAFQTCMKGNGTECRDTWNVTSRTDTPKTPRTIPFGPEELRRLSCEALVANECDSDEYRESQPWKLLTSIADLATQFPDVTKEDMDELWNLTRNWILHHGPWYEGVDQARPIYEMIHDYWWGAGRHMYYDSVEELAEHLEVGDYKNYPRDKDGNLPTGPRIVI